MRRSLSSWFKPSTPCQPIRNRRRVLRIEALESRDLPSSTPIDFPPLPTNGPTANPDTFRFAATRPLTLTAQDLLANDTYASGTSPTVEILTNPARGEWTTLSTGTWEYVPGEEFYGSDSFTYRLFDGTNYSGSATVTLASKVVDTSETWVNGFEDEPLGTLTVATFRSDETDVLDYTASIDWGDGTTTTGTIIAEGDGNYRVEGSHTYDTWGLFRVAVTLTDPADDTHLLYNLASIEFREYTHTITDGLGNTTQLVYAEGWRLTQEIDPLGNSTFFTYDSEGRLETRTDRLGRVVSFAYDADDRLLTRTWLDTDGVTVLETMEFTYDADGRLLTAGNSVGDYTFGWNGDVLTSVTNPFGITLTFGFDSEGRRTSVTDSLGGLVTSSYNTDGQLESRTLTAGLDLRLRVGFSYDTEGRLSELQRFSGVTDELVSRTQYSFTDQILASITHRGANDMLLDQWDYTFDENDHLTQIASDLGDTDYSYDADGQLTSENGGWGNVTWQYDAAGNRSGGDHVVGVGNRLLADTNWLYTYDQEGNLTEKTHRTTGEVWTYDYDHRNQMTLAEKRDAQGVLLVAAAYRYDVFGNRLEKQVDADGAGPAPVETTRFVLEGWNQAKPTPVGNERYDIHLELDGNNQLRARTLQGDGFDQTFARVLYQAGNNPAARWLLGDHLGSVRIVLDSAGAVLDRINYDAFGNIVSRLDPTVANTLFYTSREFDAETGLYSNRARYLDPSTGRWTTLDPLGFAAGDLNLYRYVSNRVTMATDPSGNAIFIPVLIIGGLMFGGTAAYTGYQSYQSTGSVFNGQVWGAAGNGLGLGAAATADGFIPFWDPFASNGVYNPNDSTLQISHMLGGVARDLLLIAAVPNIGTWIRNPLMYELGATTVPTKIWTVIENMTVIQRGQYLWANYGWSAPFLGIGSPSAFGATWATGLTPAGWLTIIGAGGLIDRIFF